MNPTKAHHLFSPTEGFFTGDGWSIMHSEAQAIMLNKESRALCAAQLDTVLDARLIEQGQAFGFSFEEATAFIAQEIILRHNGKKIARLINQFTPHTARYCGESLWAIDGDNDGLFSEGDLTQLLNDCFDKFESSGLARIAFEALNANITFDSVDAHNLYLAL